jgi:hypothetical protein
MVRCQQGHFYDPGKHTACPWCATPLDLGASGEDPAGKTRSIKAIDVSQGGPVPQPGAVTPPRAIPTPPPPPAPVAVPAPPAPAAAPAQAQLAAAPTRRFGATAAGADPVAGWLVCVSGPDRGKDFRIKMEKNFIGRASNMDVCLAGDDAISRERHAIVVFEPKKLAFWLMPGDGAGLVYLNGDVVHTPQQLREHDSIELGKTKLVFIPFCGDRYQWL